MATIEDYILWFVFYSMLGWCYEVILHSVKFRLFVNRGFLFGPYCPIYGFGAVIDIIVLRGIENPFILFLSGAFLACGLEYLTSWGMEKLFHNRWWDYSDKKFNLNGRICLLGAIVFGIFSVLLIKGIHPLVASYTDQIPRSPIHYTSIALLVLIVEDSIYSAMSFSTFSKKVKGLVTDLTGSARCVIQAITHHNDTVRENIRRNPAIDKLKALIKRMKAGK